MEHDSPLHERLLWVVGDRTYRSIGEETRHNAETVRRYLQGQAPSADFLARVCEVYDVNAHWLMTGVGARRQSENAAHALQGASPSELLAAVADTLERLVERVDRLEVFVQTMESRVRAQSRSGASGERAGSGSSGSGGGFGDRRGEVGVRVRAGRIADAVAQRSPPDDG